MTTIVQLLLVLGLMVLVHEFGHFVVAKWCGVRVETFAIGFGKRLVGFRRGGTDYQINALPLGGYVKMAGEIPGEEHIQRSRRAEQPSPLAAHADRPGRPGR